MLKLIYFEGCPNFVLLKNFLQTLPDIQFEEVKQDDLSEEHALRKYTSPSLLQGNELIYGSALSTGEGSCSFEPIDFENLRSLLTV